MFRSHPNARDVNRHVTELPVEFEVWRLDDHWAVIGPTGVFVVGRATGDVDAAASAASALAHGLRAQLSQSMSWVPFVDAFVVADRELSGLACTVVELDMLVHALTTGPGTLDGTARAQVAHDMPRAIRALQHTSHRPLDPA